MDDNQPRRGRRPRGVPEIRRAYSELDSDERVSLAAQLFCEGKSPSQIQQSLMDHFGETIRREEPYRLLQMAAAHGYFVYRAPLEDRLAEALLAEWDLTRAHVVLTAVLNDVAARAAEVLLELIQETWEERRRDSDAYFDWYPGEPDDETKSVRIGLAGGRTVLRVVRALVELLKQEDPRDLPPTLGFHTACTGITYHDPSTDPNAFMAHLTRVPGLDTKTFAVSYVAPPIQNPEVRALLAKEPEMRAAAKEFEKVDILVTAGSSWRMKEVFRDGAIVQAAEPPPQDFQAPMGMVYSQLKALLRARDPQGFTRLIQAHTVADMLWQPLTLKGPANIETQVQALTLAPLSGIPDFIERGKKVLFVLGPYEGGLDKGDVLLAALAFEAPEPHSVPPLFTHLVCDHRTARAALSAARKAREVRK